MNDTEPSSLKITLTKKGGFKVVGKNLTQEEAFSLALSTAAQILGDVSREDQLTALAKETDQNQWVQKAVRDLAEFLFEALAANKQKETS